VTGPGEATRKRIVDAAIETLKEEGFAGTSARAVAKRGGFNQALVFYHFGAMSDLLLAALDETSERRMSRYRETLEGVDDLGRLVELAGEVYREDLEAGHMTVLAEVIAGASAMPELGPEVVARLDPWVELTADALARVLDNSPLGGLLPRDDIAYAVVALYLGLELLTHLQGDRSRADALFAAAGRLGAVMQPSAGGGPVR
jgi:AcrR family transcriptional regulator